MQPLVSIIVPCYNQQQFVAECLQSVIAQTYTHWQCIVINDGSTDDTEVVEGRAQNFMCAGLASLKISFE